MLESDLNVLGHHDTPGEPHGLETRHDSHERHRRQNRPCPEQPSYRPRSTPGQRLPTPPTASYRSNYRPFTLVSQNLNGAKGTFDPGNQTRDLEKFEVITRHMLQHNIDIFLAQETWLTKTFTTNINGITVFHHGPDQPTCSRGSGGLAIFLGPQATHAWKKAGCPDPYCPGTIIDKDTRFMGIQLLINEKHRQCTPLFIGNIYAPHSGLTSTSPDDDESTSSSPLLVNFYEKIEQHLATLPPTTEVILGGDLNASVGRREPDDDPDPTIGPNGLPRRNEAGNISIAFAQATDLCFINTFYKARSYVTHIDQRFPNDGERQLDHFMITNRTKARVTNAQTYRTNNNIVISDHTAIRLTLRFRRHTPRPFTSNRQPRPMSQQKRPQQHSTRIDWTALNSDPTKRAHFRQVLDQHLPATQSTVPSPRALNEAIMHAARQSIATTKRKTKSTDWYTLSEHVLDPLREAFSKTDSSFRLNRNPITAELRREARRKYQRALRTAKYHYFRNLHNQCSRRHLVSDPKKAWEAYRTSIKGTTAHHRRPQNLNLRDPTTGKIATNNAENLTILRDFCHKLYNRKDAPPDRTVIDLIHQRAKLFCLADPPTYKEIKRILRKLKNNKAPGASQVTPEALKNLTSKGRRYLHECTVRYWNNEDLHYPEWQSASLRWMYKQKGDSKQPTNYRGIVLQDMTARVMSALLTERLKQLLHANGLATQFGEKGTDQALLALKVALQARREHNQDTHVLFVDLIKAFDTANHDLLFPLLSKYGAPDKLVNVIQRMHKDFHLVLTLDPDNQANIPYTVGVKQGDNLAPILFLILIQAVIESFHATQPSPTSSDQSVQLRYQPMDTNKQQHGRLASQPRPTKTKGQTLTLFEILFVDDGFFCFNSREDLRKGAETLLNHFRRFGLLIHVGRLDENGNKIKSKTEAMFFPGTNNDSDTENNIPNELPPDVTFGPNECYHIHYTNSFKYLGCRITPDLTDEKEISVRIATATNQVMQMTNLANATRRHPWSLRYFFQQIPINTVLYGCEAWTLTQNLKRKLQSFYYTSLRRILGITMHDVQLLHIKNAHIRLALQVPDILDIIRGRQFNFLGKLCRLSPQSLPKQLLTTWYPAPRPVGRPRLTARHTLCDTLRTILGNFVGPDGHLRNWYHLAQDPAHWNEIKTHWLYRCTTSDLDHACTSPLGLCDF